MNIEKLTEQMDQHKEILHKYGNKLNNHAIQINLAEKRLDFHDEHREKHSNEIIIMQIKQDHTADAMGDLNETIKGFSKQIAELFTIKNMVLGGCIALSTVVIVFGAVLKMILDYYQ